MAPASRPRRPVEVVLHPDLASWFRDLGARADRGSKEARTLRAALERVFEQLRADFQHGEVVRKARIPSTLVARFGISNLYVEDLPGFRRMLYTVEGSEHSVVVLVLDVIDHKKYDRLFGSRGR